MKNFSHVCHITRRVEVSESCATIRHSHSLLTQLSDAVLKDIRQASCRGGDVATWSVLQVLTASPFSYILWSVPTQL